MYTGHSKGYEKLLAEVKFKKNHEFKKRNPGMVAGVVGEKIWETFERNLAENLSRSQSLLYQLDIFL